MTEMIKGRINSLYEAENKYVPRGCINGFFVLKKKEEDSEAVLSSQVIEDILSLTQVNGVPSFECYFFTIAERRKRSNNKRFVLGVITAEGEHYPLAINDLVVARNLNAKISAITDKLSNQKKKR